MDTTSQIAELRGLFEANGVSAFVVPSQDPHNSEYIADHDKRRSFISGFSGSAGTAVVTTDRAALWTDGRYWLQASQQLDDNWKLMKAGDQTNKPPTPEEWLAEVLEKDSSVGIDPFLTTVGSYRRYHQKFAKKLNIVAVKNLVDEIWKDQTPLPKEPISAHPIEFSGQSSQDKIDSIRDDLKEQNCCALVVTALDEVCWLLNIRGADIDYNPVVVSYAVVTLEKTVLFVDSEKVSDEVKQHLGDVLIEPYDAIVEHLKNLTIPDGMKVWIDVGTCNLAVYSAVDQSLVMEKNSPIPLKKAVKNKTELQGLKNAHLRDGAAKTAWLAWLQDTLTDDNKDGLTELDVADKLEEYRSHGDLFVGLSFPTISSVGSNGAIIHYSPTPGKCALMDKNQMYLVDSGAQYRDGTTDVTRTVHLGTPTKHEKQCYTRVLQGHIALASAIFPEGTVGPKIDMLARQYLWEVGLDYAHGTGHGVGSFLNVHEGPHGISASTQRAGISNTSLVAGMTATNEPGYYEDGNFGIRIETVMVCREAKTPFNFRNVKFYEWETVTFVPLQNSLIDLELLSPRDVDWINKYHVECLEKLEPRLKQDERALKYLREACMPIKRWCVNVNIISKD